MPADEKVLFLDTNSLLHYPPIKNVDWKTVCGAKAVRLILCMQVVHELDGKKDDSRLSDRANRTIKEADTILESGGTVTGGVTLTVFDYEIRSADFPDTLSIDSKDDCIVHTVKKYLERQPDAQVAVYSEDMGMRLRCKANGIAVVKPDNTSRLPNPTSEHDKKYKAAITELNELKNRTPKVELIIAELGAANPGKAPLHFELPPAPAARDIDAELRDYVTSKNLEPFNMRHVPRARAMFGNHLRDSDFERYNAELENHLDEYRDWLKLQQALELVEARTLRFSLWLVNSGTIPADDLSLEIKLPDVFGNVEDKSPHFDLFGPPKPPARPTDPAPSWNGGLPMKFELPTPEECAKLLEMGSSVLAIRREGKDGPFRLTTSCQRLKHHEHIRLGGIRASLRADAVRPFQVNYRITAANLVQPVVGELPFLVKRTGA